MYLINNDTCPECHAYLIKGGCPYCFTATEYETFIEKRVARGTYETEDALTPEERSVYDRIYNRPAAVAAG